MQLSKLRKNPSKYPHPLRHRHKYLSLGILVSTPLLNTEQLTQKLINENTSSRYNDEDVLLSEFANELPQEQGYRGKKGNRLYAGFVRQVAATFHEQKEEKDKEKQKEGVDDEHQGDDLRDSYKPEHCQRRHINKNQQSTKKYITIVSKCMSQFYEQADKAHEIKKYKMSKLQKQIQKMYMDTHNLYIELMEIRRRMEDSVRSIAGQSQEDLRAEEEGQGQGDREREREDGNLAARETRQKKKSFRCEDPVLNAEHEKISNKIQKVKQTIQKKQQQYRKLVDGQKDIHEEKIQFLKLLLKNGYHQTDGIWWILAKLAKNNEKLTVNNFNDILDQTTKEHLVCQYQLLKNQMSKKSLTLPKLKPSQKAQPTKSSYSSLHQPPHPNLLTIPPTDPSRQIYQQTQAYIVDWVRKQRWRVRSLKHRPSETETARQRGRDWRNGEVRRLKAQYPKEKYEQMLKYVFGGVGVGDGQGYTEYFIMTKKEGRKESSYYEATPSRSVQHLTRNNTNK